MKRLSLVIGILLLSLPARGDFRFVVISDSNDRYGSIGQGIGVDRAIEVIVGEIKPAFVIHNGDMIAGQSRRLSAKRVRAMWRGYHNAITYPLQLAQIPLIPVPGNHDASPRLVDHKIYGETFRLKAHRPAIDLVDAYRYPYSYTFARDNVLFVVIDGAVGRVPRFDLPWIRHTLANSNSYSEVIVFSHVPFAKFLERSYGTLKPTRMLYRALRRRRAILIGGHYEIYFRGYFQRLRIISSGQLSHTCRVMLGENHCQGMSFLVIEVKSGHIDDVVALRGPLFASTYWDDLLPLEVGDYWRFPRAGGLDLQELIAAPRLNFDLRLFGSP